MRPDEARLQTIVFSAGGTIVRLSFSSAQRLQQLVRGIRFDDAIEQIRFVKVSEHNAEQLHPSLLIKLTVSNVK